MSTNELDHPHILKMPELDTSVDERGVGYVFFHKMKEHGDKIVQIDGITGEEDTYKSFLQRCIRTAIVMQKKGVKAKDTISICSENHLNVVVPYIAAIFLGAHAVCYEHIRSTQENLSIMEQIKVTPKMLFVSTSNLDFAKAVVKKCNCEIVVFGCSTEYTPFQEFLQSSAAENDFQPYEADSSKSIVIMQFTSTASGLPRLICISHCAYLEHIQIFLNCGYNNFKRIMMFTTLSSIYSILHWGITLISGNGRIVLPKFDGNELLSVIHLYKPTILLLGLKNGLLIKKATKGNADVSSVKYVVDTCSVMSKELLLWLNGLFPSAKVLSLYGSSEAGLIVNLFTEPSKEVEFSHYKLLSGGTPLVGQIYKVVKPETEEILGPNEVGELRLKSKRYATCYYDTDISDLFDSNGWLKTGDLVYYDTEKYFYVVDRLSDAMRVRGKTVHPLFIEKILVLHPSVEEAVVVSKTHLTDGEQPVALVVLSEKGTVTEDELIKFVDEKVDDTMRLVGGVIFVDSILLSSSGKKSRNLTKIKYSTEIEQKQSLVNSG